MANQKYQTLNELSAGATKRNSAHMLPVSDWLSDLPENTQLTDLIEVQFKNTRKGYFHNTAHLPLEKGVKVVVEANPGYDLGEVVLTGKLVELQMKKNNIDSSRYEVRQVIRIATDEDLERAKQAHAREQETMIKARQLATCGFPPAHQSVRRDFPYSRGDEADRCASGSRTYWRYRSLRS